MSKTYMQILTNDVKDDLVRFIEYDDVLFV